MLWDVMVSAPTPPVRDELVDLAERAIRSFVLSRERLPVPDPLPASLRRPAAVFVSIKSKDRLRGCLGTLHPRHATLAHEVITSATQAASEDPRFPPIEADELGRLQITVDVLSAFEPCTEADLDPRRYGVLIESGARRGLLLPDLPGVTSVEQQVAIAREKAGIPAHAPVSLFRFRVERHTR